MEALAVKARCRGVTLTSGRLHPGFPYNKGYLGTLQAVENRSEASHPELRVYWESDRMHRWHRVKLADLEIVGISDRRN
jgi:hypothetical protein